MISDINNSLVKTQKAYFEVYNPAIICIDSLTHNSLTYLTHKTGILVSVRSIKTGGRQVITLCTNHTTRAVIGKGFTTHGRQRHDGINYETWRVFEKSEVGAKSGTEPPPIL